MTNADIAVVSIFGLLGVALIYAVCMACYYQGEIKGYIDGSLKYSNVLDERDKKIEELEKKVSELTICARQQIKIEELESKIKELQH